MKKEQEQSQEQTTTEDAENDYSALFPERKAWPEPKVIEISEEVWKKPGARSGWMSGINYGGRGYRAGFWEVAMSKFAQEGTHFNVLNGDLVNGKAIKEMLRAVPKKVAEEVANHFLEECAKELASVIPLLKKPDGGFVRLYIIPSLH